MMDIVEYDPSILPLRHFASQAVRSTLGRGTDVDACVALTGEINQLLAQASQHLQDAGAGIACRVGCNFCCHLQVRVLPHEAIALFRYLKSQMPAATAQRVRAKIDDYTALPSPPLRRPCAFLIDGECSAYEVRPSACAGYHSLSKERCEQSFKDPTLATSTVVLRSFQVVAAALEDALKAELSTQGLSHDPSELHAAVAALLAKPALIARWRAGRPLLDSV
jgi:Fe-S-cluster containining protein